MENLKMGPTPVQEWEDETEGEQVKTLEQLYTEDIPCQNNDNPVNKLLDDLLSLVDAQTPQEAAGMRREDVVPAKALPVLISEYAKSLSQKKNWDIIRLNGHFHFYNGKHWVKLDTGAVRNFLGKLAEKIGVNCYTSRHYGFLNALEKQFYETVYITPPIPREDEVLINVCNGTLRVVAGDYHLKPFDKNDLLRYTLDFEYAPKAQAPYFQKYLDRVLPVKEKQQVLAEFLGYAFTRNKVLKLEKALMLYGTGANGKSVFHDVISALIGKENISHVTLQDLTTSVGYSIPILDGKLLNYASEISSKMDTTKFKTLVSGEPIQAREIFGHPFMMEDYARMMFNTNSLPTDIEHNEAFSRRLILVEFDVTIPESERDPHLAGYIIEHELSGVLNWVLDGLDRLLKNKKFTSCPEIDAALMKLKKESDSIRMFLDEKFYVPSNTEKVPRQTLYTEYTMFCNQNGYIPCKGKSFSGRLESHGFKIDRESGGRVVYLSQNTNATSKLSGTSNISSTIK